jgi:hypothetical protein
VIEAMPKAAVDVDVDEAGSEPISTVTRLR